MNPVSRRTVLKTALMAAVAGTVGGLASQTEAKAAQPRMQMALEDLKHAKQHLEAATDDKGGFRARAINSLERAIEQVEKGIEWDKTHETKVEDKKDDKPNGRRKGRRNRD